MLKRIFSRKEISEKAVMPEEEIEALPFSPAPNTICEKYKKRG